jgi:hypothetical protein
MLLTPERSEEMKARIQAAVEDALREQDLSARRASLDVVGNDGLIRDIRAGRLPGVDRLEALFEYLGLEFYLGPRRRPTGAGFAEAAPMSDPADREALRAGYLPIPWHPLAPGRPGEPAAPVAFSRVWLAEAGLDPARLAALRPEPAADGGEILALVDTAAPRQGGPSLWALREGGRARLLRVQFEAAVTVVFGATPEEAARVALGEDRARLTLLGRVVWSGRREAPGGPARPG